MHLMTNWSYEVGNDRGGNPEKVWQSAASDELRFDHGLFVEYLKELKASGTNTIILDVGDALIYDTHPEIAVKGALTPDEMRRELDYMNEMGFEVIPKLNFSSAHDIWLKDYSRMLSTDIYYKVVSDIIDEVCRIFEPRFFHIGMDEENYECQSRYDYAVVRQNDLWWHDLYFYIDCVERNGARAMMWSDAIWIGRDEYLKRMSKGVLQSNWYYRTDFSEKKLKWNYEFEKRGGWGETVNGAAAFMALEEAGFDQLPCTSNWADDGSADAVVKYCMANISPDRLKGVYTASWAKLVPDGEKKKNIGKVLEGVDLLKGAREKYAAGV